MKFSRRYYCFTNVVTKPTTAPKREVAANKVYTVSISGYMIRSTAKAENTTSKSIIDSINKLVLLSHFWLTDSTIINVFIKDIIKAKIIV